MKKKLLIIFGVVAILAILSVGTYAYFSSEQDAHNVISTGNVKLEIHEKTASGEDFPKEGIIVMPGDTVSKIVTVENTGDHPLYLRVKLTEGVSDEALTADDCLSIKENFFDVCKDGAFAMGVNTPHIVFNYLDFLIWNSNRKKYDNFDFEFRNSVEHWYPQNPSEGTFAQWKDGVDQFGNLCIIQRNVNSKFSNMSPEAKKSTFRDMISKGSLKLRIMSELTEKRGEKPATRTHYFYEIVNEQGKKIYMQFALSGENLPDDLKVICERINEKFPSRVQKTDWKWRCPFVSERVMLTEKMSKEDIVNILNKLYAQTKRFENNLVSEITPER